LFRLTVVVPTNVVVPTDVVVPIPSRSSGQNL